MKTVFAGIARFVARVLDVVRITIAPRGATPKDCNDAGPTPGCGANPRICGTSEARAESPPGTLAQYPQCGGGPHTLVRSQAGFVGLDAAARSELRFAPSSASFITIEVVHFSSPGRVEAYAGSALLGMQPMTPTPGVPQQITLNGNGIDRIVVVPASPNDVTLIVGWCH
ncbi:MAG: hypothetical protein ACRDF9_05425 [Candidatus Limnocylindria bacterium]